eukprot:g37547.t1
MVSDENNPVDEGATTMTQSVGNIRLQQASAATAAAVAGAVAGGVAGATAGLLGGVSAVFAVLVVGSVLAKGYLEKMGITPTRP